MIANKDRAANGRPYWSQKTTWTRLTRLLVLALVALTFGAIAITPCHAQATTPVETIERLHNAIRNGDAAGVDALLSPDYHGLSLQGPLGHRHVFVETREAAVAEIRQLRPGAWDIHILEANQQIDPNGLAHVWIRYVFYFNGRANHCGHESYDLFQTSQGWQVISFADTDNALNGAEAQSVCPP